MSKLTRPTEALHGSESLTRLKVKCTIVSNKNSTYPQLEA